MATVEQTKVHGPSGFIELAGNMLVVDYGTIYLDGTAVGFLYEDGMIKGTSGPFGGDGMRTIDEIHGCVFRGIDSSGMELELPGATRGPTGTMNFNGIQLNVIHGRMATFEHHLVGEFDDEGNVYVRDYLNRDPRRKLSEATKLCTTFDGKKSTGEAFKHDFVRPIPNYRRDRPYHENEIIRYFQDFDKLNTAQKKYTLDSMRIWSASGLLQVVRKSEGDCSLGNVKHGAAGVTGVRTGNVTLDREEFDKEITLFKRFGALAVVSTRHKPYTEVRVNLVVAHEFGHQLEFVLSQKMQERITDLYQEMKTRCDRLHPAPHDYDGYSELVKPDQVHERVFISGYSRTSMHEYWAEAVAAFSWKESRDMLKQLDPAIHDICTAVVLKPETALSPRFHEQILELQSALRMGGEFKDDILT